MIYETSESSYDYLIYIQNSTLFQCIVARVDEETLRELVLGLIEREPGLIFDLCEVEGGGDWEKGGGRPETQTFPVPSWVQVQQLPDNAHRP